MNAPSSTHILSIHKRSIELLPYQDFPIRRLSHNVPSGQPLVRLHVSSKVRHVPIQCQCIGKTFPSMGPSVNVDSMFLHPILLQFTLEGGFAKINRCIHMIRWRLLYPKLTKDTFGMMILYYSKIDQQHNGPPYMLAGSAIWGL